MANSFFKLSIGTLCLVLLLSSSAFGAYTEEEVVRYAKAIDIVRLDQTLPSKALVEWLRSGPRVEKLSWQSSPNCDQKFVGSSVASPEMPLCVKVSYSRGRVTGWLLIVIGSVGKGVSGKPFLHGGWVEAKDLPTERKDQYSAVSVVKLARLPVVLDEVSYMVTHKEMIDYTKGLDVRTMDQTLASQRLDDWLYSGPDPSKKLAWKTDFDCGLESSNGIEPERNLPLCVTVAFVRDGIGAWITIQIGTLARGPNGKPQLKSVTVQPMGGEKLRRTSVKLSDLPNLIARARVSTDRKGSDRP